MIKPPKITYQNKGRDVITVTTDGEHTNFHIHDGADKIDMLVVISLMWSEIQAFKNGHSIALPPNPAQLPISKS